MNSESLTTEHCQWPVSPARAPDLPVCERKIACTGRDSRACRVLRRQRSAACPGREVRVAQRYLSVIAEVSRCAEAVRDGDWRHLADAADDLCRRAVLLAEAAGKVDHAEPGLRGDVVAGLVASRNGSSQAARLLHPVGSAAIPKTAMTDPFTHPGAKPGR